MGLHSILIVDDEKVILNTLQRTFRREYNVFSALNGEDALSIMEQNDIDLIIADHLMPDMTGTELLKRASKKYPETIRIILSAYPDEKPFMDAVDTGHVHRYITKPWELEDVKSAVKEGIQTYETSHPGRTPRTEF
jgi:response regulator RpfG family c-di-GMP phosphodiesterase